MKFRLITPRPTDKKLVIACSDDDPDHALTLDYDDVDQEKQRDFARKITVALNGADFTKL